MKGGGETLKIGTKQVRSFRLYDGTIKKLDAIAAYLNQQEMGRFKKVTAADTIQFLADSYYEQLLESGHVKPIEEESK